MGKGSLLLVPVDAVFAMAEDELRTTKPSYWASDTEDVAYPRPRAQGSIGGDLPRLLGSDLPVNIASLVRRDPFEYWRASGLAEEDRSDL